MLNKRKNQIKFYTDLLKDGEILLLKSNDAFFNCHYLSSPLNVLTNFSGSEGEAIIDKSGKIKIFVDTRYHLLVDKQVFDDVEVYKMELGETFFDAFKKTYKKNTIFHLPSDIKLSTYLKFDKYFDLRKYSLKEAFLKNDDFNKKSPIFLIDKKIEKQDFEYKIEKLKKINPDFSCMLIFDPDEISYLTNLRSFQMKYSSNFRSILYLDFLNSNHILFLDKISQNFEIKGLKLAKLDDFKEFIEGIDETIFVDLDKITLENFLAIKNSKNIKQKNLALISSIKSSSIIEHLKDSSNRLDNAIFNFKKSLKEGLSEFDLAQIFEHELIKAGAKCPSFKTILALGENSASIHYSNYDKNKILKPETMILLDCGGYYEGGFATDITRTFYFGSSPSKIQKTIYTHVLKAFLACYLSYETNAKKLDEMARNILKPFEKDGFYFNHGLGHGIGTSVHQDPPRLSMVSNDIIKPYQTHSIEPGLYGKSEKTGEEFGVRIENCVFSDINYNKISLSKFPFEELLIDYSLLNKKEKEAVEFWQVSFNENFRN